MNKPFAHAVLACLVVGGCSRSPLPDPLVREVDLGQEKLASMDVNLSFQPNGEGCVQLVDGKLPDPSVPGDYCPPNAGSSTEPLPFQSSRPVRVFVNVVGISSGTTPPPFPLTGNVALTSNVATLFSGTPVMLTNGSSGDRMVRFVDGPGRVQIWAESNTALRDMDGTLQPPTFSMGASASIWMAQPTLQDVQRTRNDANSPLDGRRVDLDSQMLVVTRITSNGFNVTDLNAKPGADQRLWNSLFVFAYNGAEGLMVGSRLLKLKGAITEFQGQTQLAEPEYTSVGGECAPKAPPARYGVEETETDEGGLARRSRCPSHAECRPVDGVDRCLPKNDPAEYRYDRFGRITCRTPTTCSNAGNECPSGMHCMDRPDWNDQDANGPVYTCQACPTVEDGKLWTTWCGPNWSGQNSNMDLKLYNESLEGALLQLNNVTVAGLDLSNDFFRSGYESYGQWKVLFDSGGACVTVVSEVYPDFNALEAQKKRLKLSSITGTLRQVRFSSGSSYWMIDLRHEDDLVRAPNQ